MLLLHAAAMKTWRFHHPLLCLILLAALAARGAAALNYALNVPAAGTNGGCVLVSDGTDGNAATNRHLLAVSVTGSVTRSGFTPVSVQERLTVSLLDSAGAALDLDDGAGGTVTEFIAAPYTYIHNSPFLVQAINGAVPIRPVNLPRTGTGYKVRVKVQFFDTPLNQWVTGATRDSAAFPLNFFGSTDSADVSRNLIATMNGLTITRTNRILSVPAKDVFTAAVTVDMKRYDAFAAPAGDATVAARFVWTLSYNGPGGLTDLATAEVPVTLTIPSHGTAGALPAPATASQSFTIPFAPDSPLAPGLLDDCILSLAFYTAEEPGGGEQDEGTRTTTARLGTFSGTLLGGAASATFDDVSFEAATVTEEATGYLARIIIPAGHAQLAGPGGLSFGVPGQFLLYNWNTGDLEVLADPVLLSGSLPFTAAGVRGRVTNPALTAAGLSGQQVTVFLPAGFGYSGDARRRVLDAEMVFNNVPLLPDGVPSEATLTYAPGTFYLAHDTLPERYAVTSLTWNIAAGTFTSNGTPSYVRALETAWLAADATAPVLIDAAAAKKASNDGAYQSTDTATPTDITVAANGALTATITLADIAEPWPAHFPKGVTVPANGGSIAVVEGEFQAVSSITLSSTVQVSAARGPSGCNVTDPGNAVFTFTAAGDALSVTADGGWRGEGTVPASEALEWGGRHGAQRTHRVAGITAAALHIPGTVLAGAAAASTTGPMRVAALLYSGHGQPGDAGYVERPQTPAYDDGFADYAGLNFRNTGSPATARSHLAEQDTGDYEMKPHSKYYVRAGGVSGMHDAVTSAALTNLKLYDYDTTLDGLRLSFLDNANRDSATAGTLTTPFPSTLAIAFSKLTFTPTGGLDKAQLPDVPVTQTLAYWSTRFTPLVMTFTGKTAAACVPGVPDVRFLTLGGEVEMTQITPRPVMGSLAFKPDGNMVTASDMAEGGLDSSLPAPALIPIKARGSSTWPLRPASRVRFNNYAAADAGDKDPGDGFLSVAGGIDVSFFEDIRVIAHFLPGNLTAPVHIIGGYPSDPSQAQHGWLEAGKTPFDSTVFDPTARGYPAGVTLAAFRSGIDGANTYRTHLRKDWRRLLVFEFPMRWDAVTRSFTGLTKPGQDLVVISAEAQVKKLDATGAEMTFGAEFNGLPKLNTESLSRILSDGAGQLTGMDRKIADALSHAVTNQINNAFHQAGP